MRFVGTVSALGAIAACSSSPAEPAAIAADAGADGPALAPAACAPAPAHLDDVPAPDCAPCLGQKFSEGATCYDAPIGTECEVGDHPAWECNEIWRCTEDQHWTRVQATHSDRACSRDVHVGGACESEYDYYSACYGVHPQRMACVRRVWPGERIVVWQDGSDVEGAGLDRNVRLGCPCSHPLCYEATQCIDGRYRRFGSPTCPPPP